MLITKHQPLNVNILHILISMKQTTHPIRHHASADAYELHLFGSWRNAQYTRGMVWRAVNIPEPQSASGKDDLISRKMRRVVRFPFSLPKNESTNSVIVFMFKQIVNHHFLQKAWFFFFGKKKAAWSNHPMKMRRFFRPPSFHPSCPLAATAHAQYLPAPPMIGPNKET